MPLSLVPMPGILDRYVAASYVRVLALAAVGVAGIFYISTFLDLSDKVFRGQATWGMLGAYFWYATPQYVYYILPLSVLLATLVTIGLLTKNSELDRDEGVRHQPVSRRAADARRRDCSPAACSSCSKRASSGRRTGARKRSGTSCAAARRRRSTS